MKLSEAIEAIKDASSPEYFKSVDAIEHTDWEDVAFTFYEDRTALKRLVDEYKPHVDGAWEQVKLKTKRIDELEAGKDRLLEQLVAGEELYISRGIEIALLESKLESMTCAECGLNMMECKCDD